MRDKQNFNKLNLFKRIFGYETAKAAAAYTIERDLIDSVKHNIKIIKEGDEPNGIHGYENASYGLHMKPSISSIYHHHGIYYIHFDSCLNECFRPISLELLNQWEIIKPDAGYINYNSGNLKINCQGHKLNIYNGILEVRSDIVEFFEKGIIIKSAIRGDSHIFGTGERAHNLDLKGGRFTLWNRDADGAYGQGKDPLYITAPIYIDYTPEFSYAIIYNNSSRGEFAINHDNIKASFASGSPDFFIIFGDNLEEIISKIHEIVGYPALPPKWALGFHQSKYSYRSTNEIKEVIRGFIENDIPISALHLDIDYMDGYRIFTLNENFNDLKDVSISLRENGVNLVGIIDPGIKYDMKYDIFREAVTNNYVVKDPLGNIIKGPVWPGYSVFPDFMDARVKQWWASKYVFFKENGIEGVWHDMNEPAIFVLWGDNTLPMNAVHSTGSHGMLHNIYALEMAKAGYKGLLQFGDKRPFILSRSGWLGINSYAFVWTGDITSTWKSLKITVPMLLNLTMSGIGLSGVDVGGFSGSPSEDLYLRWLQLGSVIPFFRVHSSNFSKDREPWKFSKETLNIARKIIKFRYRILPYLYSLSFEYHSNGRPILRPRIYYEPYNLHEYSFYVGEALLVFPVLSNRLKNLDIDLPDGIWLDLLDMKVREKNLTRGADPDYFPVLQREGSILPLNEDGIIFNVLPGRNFKFTYYDDDEKINPNYIRIDFTGKEEGNNFIVKWVTHGKMTDDYKILKFRVWDHESYKIIERSLDSGEVVLGVSQGDK